MGKRDRKGLWPNRYGVGGDKIWEEHSKWRMRGSFWLFEQDTPNQGGTRHEENLPGQS